MGMDLGDSLVILVLLVIAFVIRWIHLIYINSEKQVAQNEEIIELLKKQNGD